MHRVTWWSTSLIKAGKVIGPVVEFARAGFDGWISIEDGMNGLDEIARSAGFLKGKRAQYFGAPSA